MHFSRRKGADIVRFPHGLTGGVRMKRYLVLFSAFLAGLLPSIALAEGVSGYSRGNAMLYYSLMAFVLIYGLHDTFHTKWLTWTGAIIIPILFYFSLPVQ
jgi:hypothetical protein